MLLANLDGISQYLRGRQCAGLLRLVVYPRSLVANGPGNPLGFVSRVDRRFKRLNVPKTAHLPAACSQSPSRFRSAASASKSATRAFEIPEIRCQQTIESRRQVYQMFNTGSAQNPSVPVFGIPLREASSRPADSSISRRTSVSTAANAIAERLASIQSPWPRAESRFCDFRISIQMGCCVAHSRTSSGTPVSMSSSKTSSGITTRW